MHLVCQADVEVSFEVPSLEGAEALDPALANDAQKLCSVRGADVEGGVGPFGLWVLASSKLEPGAWQQGLAAPPLLREHQPRPRG